MSRYFLKIWQMALNVLSMRRSSPPYKANRRFAVGWNVGERKPHKAACGDCGFSNPEGANSARSAYCLLYAVGAYTIFKNVSYYLFRYACEPQIKVLPSGEKYGKKSFLFPS